MAEKVQEGILTTLLAGSPLGKLGVTPTLTQNEFKLELTEAQLKELVLSGVDEKGKKAIDIKLEANKIVVTVRLF